MGLKVAIKGREEGYPEMIEYFRKQGAIIGSAKGSLENSYYYIEKGELVCGDNPKGYTLYESVKDIVKKSNTYELWD